MKILDALVRTSAPATEERGWGFDPYLMSQPWSTFSGSQPQQTDSSFYSMVETVHRKNGIVAAAVAARALLMSQVRFQWRRDYSQTRRGELWGNRDLRILERPGTCTRAELLSRLEHDVSYAGNAYVVRDGNQLRRLAPDRVSFVMRADSMADWDGSNTVTTVPYDAEVVGLAYHSQRHGDISQVFGPGDYAHWAPEPDPVNWWRGESWVSAVIREIVTDGQAVDHTSKFFENAATPNLVFKFPPERTAEEVRNFADVLNRRHAGTENAFRNMFLAGGADVQVVGSTLESLSVKDLTGGFETRIAARARIPGVILGIREGYQGSSLNAGNYSSARRMWADGWFSPTVEGLCASLEAIVPPPGGSELHYDPKAVLFLQEDQQDAAQILQTQAVTMRQLVEAGFKPSTVTEAVTTGDMSKLNHTGNVSVQLQPPGSGQASDEGDRSSPLENHVHLPEVRMPDTFSVDMTPVADMLADQRRTSSALTAAVTRMAGQQLPPPVVNVTVPQQPPAEVTVNVPELPPPTVNVEAPQVDVSVEMPRTRKRVRRNDKGEIIEVIEEAI